MSSVTLLYSTDTNNYSEYTVAYPVYEFGVFKTRVDISDLKQIRKLLGLVILLHKAELYGSA